MGSILSSIEDDQHPAPRRRPEAPPKAHAHMSFRDFLATSPELANKPIEIQAERYGEYRHLCALGTLHALFEASHHLKQTLEHSIQQVDIFAGSYRHSHG